ncbi:hypothetical protein AB0J43_36650 [Nonomuraea fuscirosea]
MIQSGHSSWGRSVLIWMAWWFSPMPLEVAASPVTLQVAAQAPVGWKV